MFCVIPGTSVYKHFEDLWKWRVLYSVYTWLQASSTLGRTKETDCSQVYTVHCTLHVYVQCLQYWASRIWHFVCFFSWTLCRFENGFYNISYQRLTSHGQWQQCQVAVALISGHVEMREMRICQFLIYRLLTTCFQLNIRDVNIKLFSQSALISTHRICWTLKLNIDKSQRWNSPLGD